MSKRRQSAEANLPLFDLPLQPDDVLPDAVEGEEKIGEEATSEDTTEPRPGGSSSPGSATARPKPPSPTAVDLAPEPPTAPRRKTNPEPPGPVQPPLFSEQDLAPKPDSEDETWRDTTEGDEQPLVQDRLLSGLADIVLLAVAVGLMVLGTQLMGVRVTPENWLPFLVFALLLSFPYAVIPMAFWGQTPGMAWVGHIARSADYEPLTFGQTARRWLGALLTLGLAGLPLLLAWRGGRSLADRLSASITLQK